MADKDLRDQAVNAVLKQLIVACENNYGASGILQLAEAYAWLVAPDESHGGGNAQG